MACKYNMEFTIAVFKVLLALCCECAIHLTSLFRKNRKRTGLFFEKMHNISTTICLSVYFISKSFLWKEK